MGRKSRSFAALRMTRGWTGTGGLAALLEFELGDAVQVHGQLVVLMG